MSFNPNNLTFQDGLDRIESALNDAGKQGPATGIVTSLDPVYADAQRRLAVGNVPGGFSKSQLPVWLKTHSQFFLSTGDAGATVGEHSHDEGDGLRYIVSGSILYDGKELKAGDWMFIPAGRKYRFDVGAEGVSMFYCYGCCCA